MNLKYIPTPGPVVNPKWKQRNKRIAKFIGPNARVLDLGCGSKNLLSYLEHPIDYIGIDYNQPLADLSINFNYDFQLPAKEWDFIVCSGLLEYLDDLDHFFSHVKNYSKRYIFTFHTSSKLRKDLNKQHAVDNEKDFELLLSKYFKIHNIINLKTNTIFACKDI